MKNFSISFDEAGNTGQDLLNEEQKVFVLASNNFSADDVTILKALFPQSKELHFKKLKDSSEGRKAILAFLNHELISEKSINIFTADKRYVVVGQIVDKLVETVYFAKGYDLYRNGGNIIFTNYLYAIGGFFWDNELFDKMLLTFVKMIRTKTLESIEDFYNTVELLFKSKTVKEYALLRPIRESRTDIADILESADKFSIDVTFSGFLVLCSLWHDKLNSKIDVIYDDSKQLEHYKEYIDSMKEMKTMARTVGYDNRKMTFPAQINSLQLVNSAHNDSVQISDLISSTIAFMYSNKNVKQIKFVEEIQNSKLLDLSNNFTVWPSDAVTPEALGMVGGEGENLLDFIAYESLRGKDI